MSSSHHLCINIRDNIGVYTTATHIRKATAQVNDDEKKYHRSSKEENEDPMKSIPGNNQPKTFRNREKIKNITKKTITSNSVNLASNSDSSGMG